MKKSVMFLGGARHRQKDLVDVDPIKPTRPLNHAIEVNSHTQGHQTYLLKRFVSGPHEWWAYVLDGFTPTRLDVVTSNYVAVP